MARRYAKSKSEAEDVAQNALMRAWRNRSKLREGDRLHEWLAQITRNEAFRENDRRRPELFEALEEEGIEDVDLEATVERSAVAAAIETLDERQRLLIELRYEADLTQSAIAEKLDMPEGTVKVLLYRARAKLRQQLEDK